VSERPQTALMVAARGRLRVNDAILRANLHLLFWLSLARFVTGWMGENNFPRTPTAVYGVVLLMAAIASWILQRTIIAEATPRCWRWHNSDPPRGLRSYQRFADQTRRARLRWREYRWWNRDCG